MFLKISIILLILYPFVHYESQKYTYKLEECWKRHRINEELLEKPICMDRVHRDRYRGKVSCEQAEEENTRGPLYCAIHAWWVEFPPYIWLSHFGNSLWFYAILATTIVAMIWQWFQTSAQVRMQRQHLQSMENIMNNSTVYRGGGGGSPAPLPLPPPAARQQQRSSSSGGERRIGRRRRRLIRSQPPSHHHYY